MKVRSMRGKEIDMSAILAQNETVVAVGNASMNARGDIVGPRGQVIKTRDEIAQEYHRSNPKAVRNVPIKELGNEIMGSEATGETFMNPADAVAAIESQMKQQRKRKIEDND